MFIYCVSPPSETDCHCAHFLLLLLLLLMRLAQKDSEKDVSTIISSCIKSSASVLVYINIKFKHRTTHTTCFYLPFACASSAALTVAIILNVAQNLLRGFWYKIILVQQDWSPTIACKRSFFFQNARFQTMTHCLLADLNDPSP